MQFLRENLKVVLVAFVTAIVMQAAPVVAHGVEHALFAHDSDQVDGFHAVLPRAGQDRDFKLLAANGNGFLPNNAIKKALDADKLDGFNSSAFIDGCPGGTTRLLGVCFEKEARPEASWKKASRICADEGRRLPNASELVGFSSLPGQFIFSDEWSSDLGEIHDFEQQAYTVNDDGDSVFPAPYSADFPFRCVAPATNFGNIIP